MTEDAVWRMAESMAAWALPLKDSVSWSLDGLAAIDDPEAYAHPIRQALLQTKSFEEFEDKLWMKLSQWFRPSRIGLEKTVELLAHYKRLVDGWRDLYAEAVLSTGEEEIYKGPKP